MNRHLFTITAISITGAQTVIKSRHWFRWSAELASIYATLTNHRITNIRIERITCELMKGFPEPWRRNFYDDQLR